MRSRSAALLAKVMTGCMSGWSVVRVIWPSASGWMAAEIVGRQAVEFRLGRQDRLAALLNVAAEFERKAGGFFMQRLQVIARGLILVDAGQTIAEQRALDVVAWCAGLQPSDVDGCERLVNSAIQAQRAAGHGYALRVQLRLVAHRLVGRHGIEHASLRARQAKLLDSRVVKPQRVLRRARPLDGKQSGERGLVCGQARTHPGGKRFGGWAPPASQA